MSVKGTLGAIGVVGAVGTLAVIGAMSAGTVATRGAEAIAEAVTEPAPVAASPALEIANPASWRLAVASWSCLQDAGITPETLHNVCLVGRKQGDWIGCVTAREQVHPCERDPATIPDQYVQRYGVCRYQEAGEWRTWAGWADIGAPVPVGWTCQVILPRGWWLVSAPGIDDALVKALRDKCGWSESEITGDSHGNCPHCLMWPEGCGPCRAIADRYGRGWPGHEGECGG